MGQVAAGFDLDKALELSDKLEDAEIVRNLTSDAHRAAIAIENGAKVYSADYDFQRFQGIQHVNPLG